jgi:hypothetical protein
VGQAIHWFDFEQFYAEVKRTGKNNAVLAVLGYDLVQIDKETDQIIHHYYEEILKNFWDQERKYLDEGYQTIPFPFEEIPAPDFTLQFEWTRDHFTGYLGTWSAGQHYMNHHGKQPLDEIIPDLYDIWPAGIRKKVTFPFLMRLGIIRR